MCFCLRYLIGVFDRAFPFLQISLSFFPKKPRQRKSKQDLNLRFTPGYKGYFNVSLVAIDSGDFTNDDVDSFVDEFSTFDKLKRTRGAGNFCYPADIISTFGLKRDVPGYLFSEVNLYFPIAVDSFGINIRVTVFEGITILQRDFSERQCPQFQSQRHHRLLMRSLCRVCQ